MTAAPVGEDDPYTFRVRLLGGPLDGSERYAISDYHQGGVPVSVVVLTVGPNLEVWHRGDVDTAGVWEYQHSGP